jgi:hypothetical protein
VRPLFWVSLMSFAAVGAFAQPHGPGGGHPGGAPPGRFGGGFAVSPGYPQQGVGNFGLPPVGPIPWVSPIQPGFAPYGYGAAGFGRRGFGYGYPGYLPLAYSDGYYAPVQAPAQNIIVVQTAPPPIVVEAPPAPANPVIHDYPQPAEAQPAPQAAQPAPPAETRTFAVVLKNRTNIQAAAVWVQNNDLHYVDANSRHGSVSLDAVDYAATDRENRARNLDLHLPPPEQ